MKQLRLIKSDFDNLDDPSSQYTNGKECPIARAFKRRGFTSILVWPGLVQTSSGVIQSDNFNYRNVTKAADKLKNGAKYAIIKI